MLGSTFPFIKPAVCTCNLLFAHVIVLEVEVRSTTTTNARNWVFASAPQKRFVRNFCLHVQSLEIVSGFGATHVSGNCLLISAFAVTCWPSFLSPPPMFSKQWRIIITINFTCENTKCNQTKSYMEKGSTTNRRGQLYVSTPILEI